jgi:hypothetical protein
MGHLELGKVVLERVARNALREVSVLLSFFLNAIYILCLPD